MSRYVVEAALGRGGMGEVFRGRRVGPGGFSRPIALKRVAAPWSGDEHALGLLEEEARVSAALVHPNIISVIDLDRDDAGDLWLFMELVDGPDLARLARQTRLSPGVCAHVAAEVLRALAHAHACGVVHRDVSPHNVLIARSGAVKLADFGVAKLVATPCSGTIKGKVAYLSPEQAAGLPIDARSDLFSLGILLYELLCGRRPFEGATESEVLARILSGRVRPLAARAPGVPRDLERVVMRLLAAPRERRYADAAEALRALMACASFPRDGMGELAAALSALDASGEASAPTQPLDRTATEPGALAVSARSLRALALGALISLAAAVGCWTSPRPPAVLQDRHVGEMVVARAGSGAVGVR